MTVVRVPVNASETLALLPKDAAIVGWVRPASADRLVDWATRASELRAELQKNLGFASAASLLAELGVEPGAPVAFAVVSPDRVEAEKLLDAVIKAKDYDAVLSAHKQAPPNGTFLRFVGRARAGVDAVTQLEKHAKLFRLKVSRCPAAKLCASFDSAKAVFTQHEWIGALYTEGDKIELELVHARDHEPRQAELLATRRKGLRGAPDGRCSKLDAEADLSLCVDGDRAGEIGAATGMLTTLSAVAGRSIDQDQRAEIAKQGKKESLRNVELAKPRRRLLDDGTLAITLSAKGFEARGSWAFTKDTKPTPTKPEPELCVPLDGVMKTLVPDVLARVGDLGDDFKKPKERIEHVREAGWGGWLVLLARTWPNFLGGMKDGAFVTGRLPVTKVCRVVSGDRLELRLEGDAVPFLDRELGGDRPGPPGQGKVRGPN